ncbi:unnamed protein product [Rhizophagus irregularis]|uniref:MATA-HMG n=2 Tax=Rhizophagus irregularis TaxID=588596 RepID=R9UE35_9GLOM|nr:MATA_HMG [Rhizophagus irregularis]ANQ33129.1 MATA-HMG [Rhizophagus irregularis]PKK74507.1 hypothetical protein RhiirC2_738751 [Rhizophagus irregularis]CAB4387027.1 unnamed protein product [Rhizophagus irregularis]CAB5385951.1 unnamed protein product [Rhizophagus irregularis]
MTNFHTPAFSIHSENNSLIIPTSDTSLLILPHSPSIDTIDTSFLFAPHSPSTSSDAASTSCSSGCNSPTVSDNEDLFVPMEQLNNVKRLLRMFPPPMSAVEFINKNPFHASDGHIKRPSNNFILFRKIAHDQKNQTPALSDYNERQFSQIIGKIWKGLSQGEKEEYKQLGKEVAEMHKKMFPKYKYQPKRDKAAWKHFNPENNNSNLKSKRKIKVKLQKNQETTCDIPKINLNIPQQQHNQQQQPIVPDNTLDYTIPVVGLEQMGQMGQMGQMSPIDQLYYQQSYPMDYFNEEYWMQQI